MYSNDLKERAINLHNKGFSYRKIQDLLDVGRSTIHRWVQRHKGNIVYLLSPKPVLIDKQMLVDAVKKLVDSNKFVTIDIIRTRMSRRFNRELSYSIIRNIIVKTLKYSFKKISKKLYGCTLAGLKNKQRAFERKIKSINTNKLICIDETGIYSNYCNNYGWSPKGTSSKNFQFFVTSPQISFLWGTSLVHYTKSAPKKHSVINL
jgi:transposase